MGGAPPHLIVLMWKNWVYYRNHRWVLFYRTIRPLLYVGLLFLVQTKLGDVNYRLCTSLGESLATDGPVPGLLTALLRSNYSENDTSGQHCLDTDLIDDADRRILENAEQSMPWFNKLTSIADNIKKLNCTEPNEEDSKAGRTGKQNPKSPVHGNLICTLLMKQILYYPNTKSGIAVQIMETVAKVIQDFDTFIYGPPAANPALTASKIVEKYRNSIQQSLKRDLKREAVKGFGTLKELQDYTYTLSKKINSSEIPTTFPGIWGILSFMDMPSMSDAGAKDAKLPFSILYDGQMTDLEKEAQRDETFWLQDLVEQAIVEVASGKQIDIGTVLKNNPSKCWHNKPKSMVYQMDMLMVMLYTALMFLDDPAVFLSEILIEKELKLREYLYIMGVGSMTLKLSWLLFYTMMELPLSLVWAAMISIMYGSIFSLSNMAFFYILLIGYNFGMLCFAYMLSNLFQRSKNSREFVYITTVLVGAIAILRFYPGMMVAEAYFARCLCLHPVTPLIIGLKYMVEWERVWVGVTWANMWMSPVPNDTYQGLGEALVWIAVDIILYVFLSWYIEKLLPGEFGQKHPFYFLFMPDYWLSPQATTVPQKIEEPKADVEPVQDKEPGIVINKMSKVYSNGNVWLNQLSLMFYKNEITAFLGHNGAGKSTAMNCLVGMVSASGGTAIVGGYDIKQNVEKVRQVVGFVPQYDILYPEFTVRDHCKFYGWLKNMSTEDIDKMMKIMLANLGLEKMIDQKTVALSGGQKRKLSIITAYLGSPQVVIFDEPSSGIDPFSRRAIWKVILEHKSTTTTVLSTHFMDQAEIIANRIAIIDEGELKCAGSPMYLKNKYGKGYRLTIARKPEAKDSVTQFITYIELIEELGNDMGFQISKEIAHSNEMITILQEIEDNFETVGILSFALNEPSLKDVFFTCTAAENRKNDEHQQGANLEQSSNQLQYKKSKSVGQKTYALLMKKLLCSIRSPSLIFFQSIVPLIFVALVLLGAGTSGGLQKDNKSLVGLPIPIQHNLLFMQASDDEKATEHYLHSAFKHGYPPVCPCEKQETVPNSMKSIASNARFDKTCEKCEGFCDRSNEANKEANGILPNGDKMFALGKAVNASSWILWVNQSHENMLVGFQFHKGNSSAENTSSRYVTVFYHSRVRQAALNLWHTALIRHLTDSTKQIQMYFELEQLADPTMMKEEVVQFEIGSFNGIFLTFGFVFGTFGLVVALINETHTGLKRLQVIYGANPYLFWVVNLGFDMLMYIGTVLLIMLAPIAIFTNKYQGNAGELFIVGVLFGYQTITFMYLLSFINSKDGNDINRYVSWCLFGAYFGYIFTMITHGLDKCVELNKCTIDGNPLHNNKCGGLIPHIVFYMSKVGSILPSFGLAEAISVIGHYNQNLPMHSAFKMQCQKMGCMCSYLNVYSFPLLGHRLLMFALWGTLNLIVVMVLEKRDFRFSLSLSCGKQEQVVWSKQSSDLDVVSEQERVESGGASRQGDPLIIKKLCKSYRGMSKFTPAVNNITFAVAKAETFGLLGLNGAGKTTTFNLLTGFEKPNSGSASMLGIDLFSLDLKRFENSSYCPQENSVFSKLTVEEHLKLVAALRGVPDNVTDELTKSLITEVGLDSHKGKRAGTLSGGNQRKLNFAMALIDYRPVIFLDEPTTGMDPGAKRRAWACIKRATARGCSVVLTSHSMEECEALCHRLVIMATGSFLCIGSVQYLKHKFGEKYVFKIKLQEQAASGDERKNVQNFVETNLPTAILMEEHGAVLSYEIPCTHTLKLSHMTQVMLTCGRTFPVEDMSVRQSSLEEIFITMGKNQDADKGAAAPKNIAARQEQAAAPQDQAAALQQQAAANNSAIIPQQAAANPTAIQTGTKNPGSSKSAESKSADDDENVKVEEVL